MTTTDDPIGALLGLRAEDDRPRSTRRFGVQPERVGMARLIMSADEIADDTERWLAQRRQGDDGQWRVTASEMAGVMGLAPAEHASAFALYFQKTAGVSIFDGSDRTDIGHALEDMTADKFAARNPELLIEPGGLFVSTVYPWLAATFDRIAMIEANVCGCPAGGHADGCDETETTLLPAGPAQCKTWAQRSDFGPRLSAVMPVYLRVQLLVEMIVLGTDTGYLPVMWLPSGKVDWFVIERDADVDRDIAAIITAGEQFIRSLDEELPPEPDWTPATTKTLRKLYPQIVDGKQVRIPVKLARRYRRAWLAHKRAEQRLGLAKNAIQFRMGDAKDAIAYDATTGQDEVVCYRQGGPVQGFTVAPKPWRESLNVGPWGKPT